MVISVDITIPPELIVHCYSRELGYDSVWNSGR